jgi:hypothetical protein
MNRCDVRAEKYPAPPKINDKLRLDPASGNAVLARDTGRFSSANRGMCETTDYSEKNLLGSDPREHGSLTRRLRRPILFSRHEARNSIGAEDRRPAHLPTSRLCQGRSLPRSPPGMVQ